MTEDEALALARARYNYQQQQAARAAASQPTTVWQDIKNTVLPSLARGATAVVDAMGSPTATAGQAGMAMLPPSPTGESFTEGLGKLFDTGDPGAPVKPADQSAPDFFQQQIMAMERGGTNAATAVAPEFMNRMPQTMPGKFIGTALEMVPGMLLGPGGIPAKLAQAGVAGIVSEAGGQLAEKYAPAWETIARLGGGIAGASVAAGVSPKNIAMATARKVARQSESPEVLAATRTAVYKALDEAGVRYDSLSYSRLGQEIYDDLIKNQHRPSNAKQAFQEADAIARSGIMQMNEPPKPTHVGKTKRAVSTRVKRGPKPEEPITPTYSGGASPSFTDLERLSQRLGQDVRSAYRMGNYSLGDALSIVREHIDDFSINAPFIANAGVSTKTLRLWRDAARQLGLRTKKMRRLQEMFEDADAYSGGFLAGLTAEINRALKSPADKQLFNKNDRALLKAVRDGKKSVHELQKRGLSLRPPNLSQQVEFGSIPAQVAFTMAHPSSIPMLAAGAGLGLSRIGKALEPHRAAKRMETAIGAIGDPTFDAAYAARQMAASRTRVRQALGAVVVGTQEERHRDRKNRNAKNAR